MITVKETFEKFEKEFLQFDRIKDKYSNRADLHAFILLDKLFYNENDGIGNVEPIIACAEHDDIWLNVEPNKLAEVATEDDIRDLCRCGVRYSDSYLKMYV